MCNLKPYAILLKAVKIGEKNFSDSPKFFTANVFYHTVCIYIYLFIYLFINLFIGLSGFTVQSIIVYGVNLFTMPGMQHIVYAKLSKILATASVVYCNS